MRNSICFAAAFIAVLILVLISISNLPISTSDPSIPVQLTDEETESLRRTAKRLKRLPQNDDSPPSTDVVLVGFDEPIPEQTVIADERSHQLAPLPVQPLRASRILLKGTTPEPFPFDTQATSDDLSNSLQKTAYQELREFDRQSKFSEVIRGCSWHHRAAILLPGLTDCRPTAQRINDNLFSLATRHRIR